MLGRPGCRQTGRASSEEGELRVDRASSTVPTRILVPVAIAIVVVLGGGFVAWDAASTLHVARDLAASGVTTTARDAQGISSRGGGVSALVDLPDGERRVELDGATVTPSELADAALGKQVAGDRRAVEHGPYAGTFEVVHDRQGESPVMAATDVRSVVGDVYLPRIAAVAGVASLVAAASLGIAAVVARRRAR
jgi:hypothetical protein